MPTQSAPPCKRCRFFEPHPDVAERSLAIQYGLCNHPNSRKSVLTRDQPEIWELFEQTHDGPMQHDRMIASVFRRYNHLCCGPSAQYFDTVVPTKVAL